MKTASNSVSAKSAVESPVSTSTTANRAKALSAMFSPKLVALAQPEKEKKNALPHIDHSMGIVPPQNLPVAVRGSHRPIPEPPLLPGMRASIRKKARVPSAAVKRLPLSVGPAPSRKMKMIFWNKITEERGVWEEVNKIQVDDLQINFRALEEKFAVPEDSQPIGGARSTTVQEKKNKKVSLLDSKRSHLIEISLNRIRRQPEEIANMLIQLNPDVLTLDLTEILSSIIPTSKEVELVKSYQGDISQLGLVEQVVLAVSPIPRLEKRLWCHRTIFTWPYAIDKLVGQLNILESGCKELLEDSSRTQFIRLFSYILSIGNFLNHGTHRISSAIQLESLLKLSTIKSNNNPNNPIRNHKETLLHYILQEIRESDKVLAHHPFPQFLKHFKYVFLLSDINYKQVQQEYKQSLDDFNRINTEYELLARANQNSLGSGDANSFLHQRLETFLILSKERIVYLDKYFQNLNTILMDTFEFFGEKYSPPADHDSSDSCQKFFHTLLELLQLIQKCSDDLEKWIEEENKLLVRQQSKQSMVDNSFNEPEEEEDEDIFDTEPEENLTTKENLFSRFRNQQTGTADDLISQLKRKMYRRQSTKGIKSLNSMSLDEREQFLSTTQQLSGGNNIPSSSTTSYVFPGLKKVPQSERKMI